MNLHELSPAPGSKRVAVRVGVAWAVAWARLPAKARKVRNPVPAVLSALDFEGGQRPLYLRLPKRGFYNKFGKDYVEINVSVLNRFEDGTVVDP